jgi:hypothetical protein
MKRVAKGSSLILIFHFWFQNASLSSLKILRNVFFLSHFELIVLNEMCFIIVVGNVYLNRKVFKKKNCHVVGKWKIFLHVFLNVSIPNLGYNT